MVCGNVENFVLSSLLDSVEFINYDSIMAIDDCMPSVIFLNVVLYSASWSLMFVAILYL